jgi:4,5-dihydroxyphthalate decarboxylase
LSKLSLSIAVGDYDRTRPLADGSVAIDGVAPTFLLLPPEEMFFRAFRHVDFDVCELSLSSFALRTARGENPYIGIPVFPSRAFRHTAIVVRRDRGIDSPQDLKGRRIGTPEYQLSACVWARGILQDEYDVRPEDIIWVRGGMEDPGRIEKISLNLPPAVRLESAPAHRTLSDMLAAGEIDGIIGPRLPSCFGDPKANVGWLFRDTVQTASQYFQRTGIFPIMHVIGVRRALAEEHPWLPATLLKAFSAAKTLALLRLADTSATKVTLPFVEEQLVAARRVLGQDFWSYGFSAGNREALDTFLGYHHAQGLSERRVTPEELFHPGALELYKI